MLRKHLLTQLLALALMAISCTTPRAGDLVDVQKKIPNIVLDIRYATTNNFTGQKLYPAANCFLRRQTADKLAGAQKDFNALGLGLKIYDGYRPLSVQRKMWEVYPHEGYVANPAKGSRHNRGAAVDVTLIQLKTGAELPMPSPYDDFTEKAGRYYYGGPEEALRNRALLERVMLQHGFVGLGTEWWHFDDTQWQSFELLDIDVSTVGNSKNQASNAK